MSGSIWMAIGVTMFLDSGPALMAVVPEGLMTHDDCMAWKERAEDRPTPGLDPLTGRMVMFTHFECVPQGVEILEMNIEAFRQAEGQG